MSHAPLWAGQEDLHTLIDTRGHRVVSFGGERGREGEAGTLNITYTVCPYQNTSCNRKRWEWKEPHKHRAPLSPKSVFVGHSAPALTADCRTAKGLRVQQATHALGQLLRKMTDNVEG